MSSFSKCIETKTKYLIIADSGTIVYVNKCYISRLCYFENGKKRYKFVFKSKGKLIYS